MMATTKIVRKDIEDQRRRADACRRMDLLAEKLGTWNPVPIIRRFRNAGGIQSAKARPKSSAKERR